jgi:hypothetical protein
MFLDCDHDSTECRCYASAAPASQSLDELGFVRSACHAAQIGNIEKLQRILRSKPEAVSWDGGTGGPQQLVSAVGTPSQCLPKLHPGKQQQ